MLLGTIIVISLSLKEAQKAAMLILGGLSNILITQLTYKMLRDHP